MSGGAKSARIGLVAGVTVGGAMLSFTYAVDAASASRPSISDAPRPVAQRIERLREKIRVAAPTFVVDAKAEKTDKLVQFFKFSNCIRGSWHNC